MTFVNYLLLSLSPRPEKKQLEVLEAYEEELIALDMQLAKKDSEHQTEKRQCDLEQIQQHKERKTQRDGTRTAQRTDSETFEAQKREELREQERENKFRERTCGVNYRKTVHTECPSQHGERGRVLGSSRAAPRPCPYVLAFRRILCHDRSRACLRRCP